MASADFTSRMKTLANLAASEGTVADIGCDHGLTGIYMIMSGNAKSVIAMDLRKEPLRRAMENAKSFGVEEKIDFRLSDGFEKLREGESDTAILAGMGGRLIVKLLKTSGNILCEDYRLILSPHTDVRYVREFLENAFIYVEDEIYMEEDGIRYNIISAKASSRTISALTDVKEYTCDDEEERIIHEANLRYGYHLIKKKDAMLLESIKAEIEKKEKLLKQIVSTASPERLSELETDLLIAKVTVSHIESDRS